MGKFLVTAIVNCVTIATSRHLVGIDVNYLLYRPDQERDACGIGFVADIAGKPGRATSDGTMITGSEATCQTG